MAKNISIFRVEKYSGILLRRNDTLTRLRWLM